MSREKSGRVGEWERGRQEERNISPVSLSPCLLVSLSPPLPLSHSPTLSSACHTHSAIVASRPHYPSDIGTVQGAVATWRSRESHTSWAPGRYRSLYCALTNKEKSYDDG
jgi:hypothetical protein